MADLQYYDAQKNLILEMFDTDIIFRKDTVYEEGKLLSYKQLIHFYWSVCTLQQ